jgi:hypothetical protein
MDAWARLEVQGLHRQGLLRPGVCSHWHWPGAEAPLALVLLAEEAGVQVQSLAGATADAGQAVSYRLALDWVPCPFGGQRPWWRCPVAGCGRRVAVLYGGPVFACRHCLQLAYASQREGELARAMRRAAALRRRLGWEPDAWGAPGDKPRGMQWRTYRRLEAALAACTGRALASLVQRQGRGTGRA